MSRDGLPIIALSILLASVGYHWQLGFVLYHIAKIIGLLTGARF